MNCNDYPCTGPQKMFMCSDPTSCLSVRADGLLQRQRERGQLHRRPAARPPGPGHLLHALLLLAPGNRGVLLLAGGEDAYAHTHTHTHSITAERCSRRFVEIYHIFMNTPTYEGTHTHTHTPKKNMHIHSSGDSSPEC